MEELTGITKYIDEIINGDDENLDLIKEKLNSFFHGKTQQDFDKIEKKKLQKLIRILDIINQKKNLTEIDRALLDNLFHNKKPLKYYWLYVEYKLHPARFRAFRDFLIKEIDFGKEKEGFIKWVDWMIGDEIDWDDGKYVNVKKDFKLELYVTHYEIERPGIEVIMIGDKKYKDIMKKAAEWIKPPVLNGLRLK